MRNSKKTLLVDDEPDFVRRFLEDIGKDNESANAMVILELPVTTEAGCGSLLGEETIAFNVFNKVNLRSYYVRTKLPHFSCEPQD